MKVIRVKSKSSRLRLFWLQDITKI